jgi:hypothetical protein
MAFLKYFFRNLALLAVLVLVIYLIEPEMVGGAFQNYWQILGPVGLLIIIVAAIPKRRSRRD